VAVGGDGLTWKTYTLSPGKLEDLTTLMVLDEVPILVRPHDDSIDVQASALQHQVFGAFCKMIDGEDQVVAYELPDGKLSALTGLMVRSDVPIIVEPGDEAIKVHGTDLEQAVFGAFVQMIHPTREHADAEPEWGAVARALERYEMAAAEPHLHGLETMLEAYGDQIEAILEQVEQILEQAEAMEEEADELADEAEELEEEAEELRGPDRAAMMAEARMMAAQADKLEKQARALERQAEAMERQAEKIEEHADQVEDRIQEEEDSSNEDD
jgi:hypothetical protein